MKFILGIVTILIAVFIFQGMAFSWEIVASTRALLDAPTIFVLIVITFGTILATDNLQIFLTTVKSIFSKKYNLSEEERLSAINLFKLLHKTVLYSSFLLAAMSVTALMGNLSDWDLFWNNIAINLLIVFYAALINLIFLNPILFILKQGREK